MKTLLLMKHAESDRDHKLQGDWFRPLSEPGKMDAYQMGELLIDKNLVPDLILTSSAVRAYETASIAANAFYHHVNLRNLDSLYLAEMEVYYQEIQRVPNKVKNLLVVGHGPNLDRILQVMIEKVEFIPFSAVAYVTVSIDSWKDFRYDVQGDLVELIKVDSRLPLVKDHASMAEAALYK
jgi:phosphohistidine phosphatase